MNHSNKLQHNRTQGCGNCLGNLLWFYSKASVACPLYQYDYTVILEVAIHHNLLCAWTIYTKNEGKRDKWLETREPQDQLLHQLLAYEDQSSIFGLRTKSSTGSL